MPSGKLVSRQFQYLETELQQMADSCHHWGGHLSSGGERFLAMHIAPWIQGGN